jgi:hypothetical protein
MSELVFQKTELKKDFNQLSKLIFGLPKSGKSTIASKMIIGERMPLFISTEDGLGALEVYAQRVDCWSKFLKVKDYIIENKDAVREKFSTLVVDLVSDLDEMCTAYICEKNKVKSLADLPFGSGWYKQSTEFQFAISQLFNVLPVTFICHCKEKEFNYNGASTKIQAPSLQQRCFDFVNGKVDCIGFIIPANDKKDKPALTFRPSMMAVAGSRFDFMTTVDFILDYKDMQGSYNNINQFFQDNITKREEKPNE